MFLQAHESVPNFHPLFTFQSKIKKPALAGLNVKNYLFIFFQEYSNGSCRGTTMSLFKLSFVTIVLVRMYPFLGIAFLVPIINKSFITKAFLEVFALESVCKSRSKITPLKILIAITSFYTKC